MTRLKTLLTALLTLSCVFIMKAETHYKPHVSIGAHAGMTLSQYSFSPSFPQKWLEGMTMGVTARYAEEKLVGIIGEINISQRGWKENFEDNPELSFSRTFTYIQIPILTHIYFGPPRFKCFFNLGPEISYMIGESRSANFDYNDPSGAHIPSTRQVLQMTMEVKNKFDYGISAGVGCEFFVHPRHSVAVEGRFYYGLGNIFPASKADHFAASRGMCISVMAAYNFRVK